MPANPEEELLPNEQVNEFMKHLQDAQKEVEAAARIVCSCHNPAAIEAYNSCRRFSREIGEVVCTQHKFRDFES